MLTNATGAVTDRYDYDSFGDTISQTGTTPNVYLYSGEQLDPNVGFYYLRARYYRQPTGRFLTTDPQEGDIFDPVSLHRYLYASANPITFIDPTGEAATLVDVAITVSMIADLTAAFVTGYRIPNLVSRAYKGELGTAKLVTELAQMALLFVPGELLETVALRKILPVVRQLEEYGIPVASEGFYHLVRRMFQRGISAGDVLRTLEKGTPYFDTIERSFAWVLDLSGTRKLVVILKEGKLVTVFKNTGKLGKKYVLVSDFFGVTL